MPRDGTTVSDTDSASHSYEAMVHSANLPNRLIAFTYRDGGPRLAGGVYRITRIRTATEQDLSDFRDRAPMDHCPLCGQLEDDA